MSHLSGNPDKVSLRQYKLSIKFLEAGFINFNESLEQFEKEPSLTRPHILLRSGGQWNPWKT